MCMSTAGAAGPHKSQTSSVFLNLHKFKETFNLRHISNAYSTTWRLSSSSLSSSSRGRLLMRFYCRTCQRNYSTNPPLTCRPFIIISLFFKIRQRVCVATKATLFRVLALSHFTFCATTTPTEFSSTHPHARLHLMQSFFTTDASRRTR